MQGKFKVLEKLIAYSYLGEKTIGSGTILIGRAPHIAPQAWLHSFFDPLTENEIQLLEGLLTTVIPDQYKEFLMVTNGLGIFNTTISLFGMRRNYGRSVDAVWQPFDIVIPNKNEKPPNAKINIFIIGSYDWDGSYLYIDSKTNKVHMCERGDSTSLYEWSDFYTMLESEIKRLVSLHDKAGKELFPGESTLPTDY